MTSGLASRLGEIPGVASVVIDLEGYGRGIDVRLEPDADEVVVMEHLRALLAAYGVRRDREPAMSVGRGSATKRRRQSDVSVIITPINTGARIEVATETVKSFRIVAATPLSIAQGLIDAWCQVKGRVPLEIVGVSVDEERRLRIEASDGEREFTGTADTDEGWIEALTGAVGSILDDESTEVAKAAS